MAVTVRTVNTQISLPEKVIGEGTDGVQEQEGKDVRSSVPH